MVEPVESEPAAGGAIRPGLASSSGSQARADETEPFGGRHGPWRGLVERTSVAVIVVSAGGDVLYASPAAERILGKVPGSFADVVAPGSLGQVSAWLDEVRAAAPQRRVYFETTIHCGASRAVGESERHIELVATNLLGDPDVAGIVIDLADVTGRWQQAAELTRRAFYDPLTALPNRMLMADRLEQLVAGTSRHGGGFGVVMVDLDMFKSTNDAHGHGAGDEVLAAVARRMVAEVRAEATVARFGGDEFVVLLPGANAEDALAVAGRLLEAIGCPITLSSGAEVAITACAGVARHGGSGPVDEGVRHADMAMYAAKSGGRNQAVVYDGVVRERERQRVAELRQLDELRRANADLARRARLDALTGMANQGAYSERLEELDVESLRDGTFYSLLFCDIDFFGVYNKRWGEQAGDDVLRMVASAIATEVRRGDEVYRRGGEEFVVVLPATGNSAARALSERIRAGVEHLRLPHNARDDTPIVTLSIGVATLDPRRHRSAREVETEADVAMVAAKAAGRNHVR